MWNIDNNYDDDDDDDDDDKDNDENYDTYKQSCNLPSNTNINI